MSVLRTKCISTKVTDEEYARLEGLAGERTLSEWVRGVLLNKTIASSESILLAEVLALRAILLNLHFAMTNGEPLTADAMHRLIERADHDKFHHANACLASTTHGGQHD